MGEQGGAWLLILVLPSSSRVEEEDVEEGEGGVWSPPSRRGPWARTRASSACSVAATAASTPSSRPAWSWRTCSCSNEERKASSASVCMYVYVLCMVKEGKRDPHSDPTSKELTMEESRKHVPSCLRVKGSASPRSLHIFSNVAEKKWHARWPSMARL
jgi:hypothetical protein